MKLQVFAATDGPVGTGKSYLLTGLIDIDIYNLY